jgi:hypothetical protein
VLNTKQTSALASPSSPKENLLAASPKFPLLDSEDAMTRLASANLGSRINLPHKRASPVMIALAPRLNAASVPNSAPVIPTRTREMKTSAGVKTWKTRREALLISGWTRRPTTKPTPVISRIGSRSFKKMLPRTPKTAAPKTSDYAVSGRNCQSVERGLRALFDLRLLDHNITIPVL